MTRAILFDVDGTLVDTVDLHARAWQQAFRHFGHDLPVEKVRAQIGKGGDNLVPALLPDVGEDRQRELKDYRSTLFQHDYLPLTTPFPKVRDLFVRLYDDGVRIVLASSAKRAELDFHIGLIGAEDLIAASTSQDDVESSKPCPDVFEAALGKVAPVAKEEALVVGDSPWDVEAACNAGLRTVAVLCGGFPEADLRGAGAKAIYDSPEELLDRYPEWLEV